TVRVDPMLEFYKDGQIRVAELKKKMYEARVTGDLTKALGIQKLEQEIAVFRKLEEVAAKTGAPEKDLKGIRLQIAYLERALQIARKNP
ncbi:MAG TPA: hypothetical protein VD713_01225, partial [Sphingomonadales bacterium]|nr:hypothetical protein [Sphingomonadales bacterium]